MTQPDRWRLLSSVEVHAGGTCSYVSSEVTSATNGYFLDVKLPSCVSVHHPIIWIHMWISAVVGLNIILSPVHVFDLEIYPVKWITAAS